jgi:hypothetical protein
MDVTWAGDTKLRSKRESKLVVPISTIVACEMAVLVETSMLWRADSHYVCTAEMDVTWAGDTKTSLQKGKPVGGTYQHNRYLRNGGSRRNIDAVEGR